MELSNSVSQGGFRRSSAPRRLESSWGLATRLLEKSLGGGRRLDWLLERVPEDLSQEERRRCQFLLYGAVRHQLLLETAIGRLVRREPGSALKAVLMVAAFELLSNPEDVPVIVHHGVEEARLRLSRPESGFVNAVLRRVLPVLQELRAAGETANASIPELAVAYSHPEWLVARWDKAFGRESLLKLLRWNQEPAPVYARFLKRGLAKSATLAARLEATDWESFYRISGENWPIVSELLASGSIYLQDPATRLAPGLLNPQAGDRVLDLCAAPGGKSLYLAEAAGPDGSVVAVDIPGKRLRRMQENVERYPDLKICVEAGDLLTMTPEMLTSRGLPDTYDAVLVDVPCSNTGVMRHRVDAKWSLSAKGIDELVGLQLKMLHRAAAFVRAGGRLVYSTCSIETDENEGVAARFAAESGFRRGESAVSLPWKIGHDGAAAFLFHRPPS